MQDDRCAVIIIDFCVKSFDRFQFHKYISTNTLIYRLALLSDRIGTRNKQSKNLKKKTERERFSSCFLHVASRHYLNNDDVCQPTYLIKRFQADCVARR